MIKLKQEKSFAVFADFRWNRKASPTNFQLSNDFFSTFLTNKAKTTKVFPIFR